MKTKINKKYSHFAVHTKSGKIVDGWEYPSDMDISDIKEYYKQDAKDNDYSAKEFKLVDALTLFKKGVNPYDSANWCNAYELNVEEVAPVIVEPVKVDYSNLPQNELFVVTKDYYSPNTYFVDATDEQKDQIKKDGFTAHFKMYDDDDTLAYGGYLKTELDGTEEAFAPLDDYGMPNFGCTDIKYRNADGTYSTL